MVYRISLFIVIALVLAAGVAPDAFNAVMQAALKQTIGAAGSLYLLVVFAALVFLLFLCVGRFADLRIGGEDAQPQFSNASWLSMLFAAGMGIGLVFWGAAEPLSHFITPPEGLQPRSMDAARAAMRYAFFHWGLHPWSVYALIGLAMAWFQFNRGGRGLISDLLEPVLGRRHEGWIGHAVNIAAVVATTIGVATTLGFGTIQIAAGLERVFGIHASAPVQLTVIAVSFVLYMASSVTGVERGIKWLSNFNVGLAALLLAFVLVLGPTSFIFDTFTTTLGSYLNSLVNMSLRMSPFSRSTWVATWTIFYWAWWIAWAPFVGAFIARVSYGRRIREFVFGVVLAPSLLGFLWFSTFGGAALWAQLFGHVDLAAALAQGYETVLFAMFDSLPLSWLLSGLALLLLSIFFVTSADSAVLVLASMSYDKAQDPPLSRKIVWGSAIALIAATLLLVGGLEALQAMITVAALPFALLMVLVIVALYRALDQEYQDQQRRLQRDRRAIAQWLERERER
ncbi:MULTISPECIES: BCCT family transporter [Pseudoxanthomonas]|uniref:BCCT family transporter n=1 Tax=Pseudoxanthomonas winnipegensis TaxID=2480810 RepID=A0A4Q8LRW5_9GAMM|nr:BCCT family transporter [Pseudoxanthomonas winnipegensis]RZZ84719.1 BCCT family transporter [Pseudoxanthomonas winnipegensis]TAA12150.1 BCCT family transporter [Pseudoxanthomonas winnipegensis]TAA19486.1 BCCT family transporter [Pseudoxanthomonas winnipegensis]TAA31265.1 BCCT family transporter [Pseudoxanthomonas winnipegensis]TAA33661.1 BCCT family transporter [Pseudoxanthomonas winnipegensis]